jgi:hypothetical protein
MSIVYKLIAEGLIDKEDLNIIKSIDNNSNKVFVNDNDDDDIVSIDYDSSSDYVDEGCDSDSDSDDSDYSVEKEENDEYEYEYADMPNLIHVDDLSEVDKLTDRVWGLETSISQISSMVKTLFDNLSFKNKKRKLEPLRKTI